MAKINLQQDVGYKIEVNDNGDYIVIDYEDVNFPVKLNEMYTQIQKATDTLDKSMANIEKQTFTEEDGSFLSGKELARLEAINAFYSKGRNAIDIVFGEGASMKIFGSANRLMMFKEFFEAIEPHLEKAGIDFNAKIEETRQKYQVKKDNKKVI